MRCGEGVSLCCNDEDRCFPPCGILLFNNNGFRDLWMVMKDSFNFGRIYIFPAGLDKVSFSVDVVIKTIFPETKDISAVIPPIFKYFCSCIGIGPIAAE